MTTTPAMMEQILRDMGYREPPTTTCGCCRHHQGSTCNFTGLYNVPVSLAGICNHFQAADLKIEEAAQPGEAEGEFTKNIPTEPGFYEWRRGPGAAIWLIDIHTVKASGKLRAIRAGVAATPKAMKGEWRLLQMSGTGNTKKFNQQHEQHKSDSR